MLATRLLFDYPVPHTPAGHLASCSGRRENCRCRSLQAIRMLVRAAQGTAVA